MGYEELQNVGVKEAGKAALPRESGRGLCRDSKKQGSLKCN